MKLYEFLHKKIKLTTDDNQVFIGVAEDYTEAEDNEPQIDSICIGDYEFLETDIKSIEILK